MEGWISLYRKFTEWQWYQDINTKTLFIHLLLKANHKDQKWLNIIIKRGQLVTSLENLSIETGLTIRQVRTALQKLKSSEELTIKTTSRYSLINVVNYSKYQDREEENDKVIDKQMTSKRQTDDKQATTNNNDNNVIMIINNNKYFENEELNKIFLEYLELRKKLKAVNTERAVNNLLKILDPYEDSIKIKMIEQSIVSSWKSIYELKADKQTKKPSNIIQGKLEGNEDSYYDIGG